MGSEQWQYYKQLNLKLFSLLKSKCNYIFDAVDVHLNCNKDYINVIHKLSEIDSPKYFGLPENVDQSWQFIRSAELIEQLKLLNRDLDVKNIDWKSQLTPILNLWKKINQDKNLIQLKIEKDILNFDSPLSAFLYSEFLFAIHLVQKIHLDLANISKVIRGSYIADNHTTNIANEIINQQTPDDWQSIWSGSQNPLLYLRSVVSRASDIYKRYNNNVSFLKDSVDLSRLFHPQSFLSVLKQHTAREFKIPLDELNTKTDWSLQNSSRNEISVTIIGLLIEGAQFENQKLAELTKESPICSSAPPLSFSYYPKTGSNIDDSQNLQIPLYSSSSRETIITELDIPVWSEEEKNKWLQSGTALYIKL